MAHGYAVSNVDLWDPETWPVMAFLRNRQHLDNIQEDTKGNSNKDRQFNGQKKKDKQRSTKHDTEN
jgi:hypothetical protein